MRRQLIRIITVLCLAAIVGSTSNPGGAFAASAQEPAPAVNGQGVDAVPLPDAEAFDEIDIDALLAGANFQCREDSYDALAGYGILYPEFQWKVAGVYGYSCYCKFIIENMTTGETYQHGPYVIGMCYPEV